MSYHNNKKPVAVSLLPCPWCNGEAVLEQNLTGRFSPRCDDENCIGFMVLLSFARRDEAIAAWNTRLATRDGAVSREIDPYAHADGSRECRPAAGKWSRPDAEARASELLADIFEAGGDNLAAFTLRHGGPLGTVLHAQVDLLAKALAALEGVGR